MQHKDSPTPAIRKLLELSVQKRAFALNPFRRKPQVDWRDFQGAISSRTGLSEKAIRKDSQWKDLRNPADDMSYPVEENDIARIAGLLNIRGDPGPGKHFSYNVSPTRLRRAANLKAALDLLNSSIVVKDDEPDPLDALPSSIRARGNLAYYTNGKAISVFDYSTGKFLYGDRALYDAWRKAEKADARKEAEQAKTFNREEKALQKARARNGGVA